MDNADVRMGDMMKPIVFNYSDYEKVVEENKKLKAEVANLLIRCRIAESEKPDRDCKSCKHNKPDGCSRWECEYEPRMSDLISRQDAIEVLMETIAPPSVTLDTLVMRIDALPSADRPKGEWIPVRYHEITDEEREENGYPKDWVVYLDCEMPSDEQSILVSTRYGTVSQDVCYEDGEFSLDSGYDWMYDIVAWMPLPEPYKGGDKE